MLIFNILHYNYSFTVLLSWSYSNWLVTNIVLSRDKNFDDDQSRNLGFLQFKFCKHTLCFISIFKDLIFRGRGFLPLLRLPNHWWNVLFIKRALLMLILLLVSVRLRPCTVVTLKRELKASELKSILPVGLEQILSYATETGASSWLNALPIHERGFALHKGAFRDTICL